jgi:uncharacterized protein YecE (DUF72 family)
MVSRTGIGTTIGRKSWPYWAKRIEESGAKSIWAYFNNDRDGYAIKNARVLMRLLANEPTRRKR